MFFKYYVVLFIVIYITFYRHKKSHNLNVQFPLYIATINQKENNILVKQKHFVTETLPLFIILIGVTSGIIVFSAFVILLILCHRRRRRKPVNEKPDVTVTDMYKESDRSSNISDLKLQLPQSDGSYDLVSLFMSHTELYRFNLGI